MKRPKQYIVLPDVHAPWHNAKLLRKVCQLITDIRPHGLILSGDFLDLYSIASHNKGKVTHGWDLKKEYNEGERVLGDILSAAKHTKERYFLYGNHEDRFIRWMQDVENAKLGKALGSPEEAL